MLDAEDYIEELDERALRVAAAAILFELRRAGADVKHDPSWQSSVAHILASGQKRADLVIEHMRIAVLK